MSDTKKQDLSRKEFIKKSSAGIIGVGLSATLPDILASPITNKHKTKPRYRTLGRTGLKVTTVGFGASRTMEPALIKAALGAGINFIDTGRHYFNGKNESMVGEVVKGNRGDVIIQSKVQINVRAKGNELNTPLVSQRIKKMMQLSLEQSLKALKTDYIDVLLIHRANSIDIIQNDTVLNFFEQSKQSGKIRAAGFSSHENQVELLKENNKTKFFDVVMVPYNHKGSFVHSKYKNVSRAWDQPALEKELIKAEENKIGIVAMKTCSAGPYVFKENGKPCFKDALEWVINHNYINTMAVAMANFDEVNHDVKVMLF